MSSSLLSFVSDEPICVVILQTDDKQTPGKKSKTVCDHHNIHPHHHTDLNIHPHHSPLAHSSHPTNNHLNHHHQYYTTTTPTTTIIFIVITSIHLLTPHTIHGLDIIHSFQHKSPPAFNDYKITHAMPYTNSPHFSRHTQRNSTIAMAIIKDNVYSDDNSDDN